MNYVKNPSLPILSLSQSLLYSIFIRFRFSTLYQSPKALTSNSILALLHFNKKKSHPKSSSPQIFFFSQKLITNIGLSHQDRQNPYYPIRIQACTRSHTRPIVWENFEISSRITLSLSLNSTSSSHRFKVETTSNR